MLNFHKRAWGLSLATLGILSALVPARPLQAFPSFDRVGERDYRQCAQGLREAGLSPEITAEACAMAIRPSQLAECVSRIGDDTGIAAEEAVLGCVGVRRPAALATCVFNITASGSGADPLNVLESCGRSLLPEQYSFCVVGMSQGGADYSTDDLLEVCLHPPEQFIDLYGES
ncbi:MAG: hypothetical protein ACP5D7_25830 [Limnospira sp.]